VVGVQVGDIHRVMFPWRLLRWKSGEKTQITSIAIMDIEKVPEKNRDAG
jgi:hypothetical protein